MKHPVPRGSGAWTRSKLPESLSCVAGFPRTIEPSFYTLHPPPQSVLLDAGPSQHERRAGHVLDRRTSLELKRCCHFRPFGGGMSVAAHWFFAGFVFLVGLAAAAVAVFGGAFSTIACVQVPPDWVYYIVTGIGVLVLAGAPV